MTQEASNPKESLSLKLPEPEVSSSEPWGDDVLGRAEIAGRLTNLIRDQSSPFTISIHGYWGTGKTFMLKRWQKDLENQGFQAIYFNAWEDDFCNDPLLAIIGQLSDHFNKEESTFKSLAASVGKKGVLLLKQNAMGLVEKHIGITLELKQGEIDQWDPLEDSLSQRATKDDLKKELTNLSNRVREETGHPLVFIIDELDRCRPTFAIELLERVKHIFDVRDLVFVFGLNRDELCKSLASVYGDIEVDVYLRRFFDMEFTLPEADGEKFGGYLMQRYGLSQFFTELSRAVESPVHENEFQTLADYFPSVWTRLGLSLREIDYCVRLIALVGKNVGTRHSFFPLVLGLLIPLKHCNPVLYRRFVEAEALASEVMNYVYETVSLRESEVELEEVLKGTERYLYFDDRQNQRGITQEQLQLLADGEPLTRPDLISKRTLESDNNRVFILQMKNFTRPVFGIPRDFVDHLVRLIDLHQGMVRR